MNIRAIPEPRGSILHPERAHALLDHRRLAPDPALAPFVAHHWFIRWDLEVPFVQGVLPRPTGNLVSEPGAFTASGVHLCRYDRALEGSGDVFGTMLTPAGLRALLGVSAKGTVGRRWDVAPALGWDAQALFDALCADPDDGARVTRLTERLLSLEPRIEPGFHEVNAWVELAGSDPSLTRAEDLATAVCVPLRTLQRHLARHVGVGPKVLLRRFRLLEASAALAEGTADLAGLAYRLGYADQAHLTRDFRAMVGQPPAAYARQQGVT